MCDGDAHDGGRPTSPKLSRIDSTADSTAAALAAAATGEFGIDVDIDAENRRSRSLSIEMSAFDGIVRLTDDSYDDDEMNLFEWFMDGEDRSGAALAYSFSQTAEADPSVATGDNDVRVDRDDNVDDDGDRYRRTGGGGGGVGSAGGRRRAAAERQQSTGNQLPDDDRDVDDLVESTRPVATVPPGDTPAHTGVGTTVPPGTSVRRAAMRRRTATGHRSPDVVVVVVGRRRIDDRDRAPRRRRSARPAAIFDVEA